MRQDTLKLLAKAFNAASKDQTRFQICSVRVSFSTDHITTITACDGHILAETKLQDDSHDVVGEFFFNREYLPMIKTLAKNRVCVTALDDKGNLTVGELLKGKNKQNFNDTSGHYPNTEQLWVNGAVIFETSFNAELLYKLAECFDGKTSVVKLQFREGKLAPITVLKDDQQKGLLMPAKA